MRGMSRIHLSPVSFPIPAGMHSVCMALMVLGVAGCGRSNGEPAPQAQLEPDVQPSPVDHQGERTASREDSQFAGQVELASAAMTTGDRPVKGSAEWLLLEIAHLKNAPLGTVRQPIVGRPGEFEEVQLTAEQAAQEQTRRYVKTVELAMQAISKTHQAEDQISAEYFNTAVHYLSGARMQLALGGSVEHGQLLDENVEALFTRDPTSFAAIDAATYLVDLTHTMATRHAEEDSKWALAFARQARLFAERFPQETSRAAVNLIAAGRLCEQLGLDEDAESCLAVIEQIAPDSPYSEQISGSLRRLRLPGQPLTEFGGSTFDGGFTSIDQFRGKNVIIAFWASNSNEFRQHLPVIQSLVEKSQGQLAAVGVNMDRDDRAVERFTQETGMKWKNIFYSDLEKRGSRNVIARHYGITNVPEYWLVDANGVVRSIHLHGATLEQDITAALRP